MEALALVLALLNGVRCDYAATDPGNFTLLNYTRQVLGVEESCLGSEQAGTTDYDRFLIKLARKERSAKRKAA